MVSTHLFITWGKYWRSFTEIDVSFFFQLDELPFNKWVVIRIHVRCYKWPCIVDMDPEFIQMCSAQWRKISNPVFWVNEFWNLFIWNIHHFQQIVLEFYRFNVLRKLGWVSIFLQLFCQLNCCCTNRHTCTMKSEGK